MLFLKMSSAFTMIVLLSSLANSVINISVLSYLLIQNEYFFGICILLSVLAAHSTNVYLYHHRFGRNDCCAISIATVIPIIYYHKMSISCTNHTQLTSLITNPLSNEVHFNEWQKSKRKSLYLSLTQSIIQTIPCLIFQTFILITIHSFQYTLIIMVSNNNTKLQ